MDTMNTYTQAEVDELNQLIDRLLAEKADLLKALKMVDNCWALTDEICEQVHATIVKVEKTQYNKPQS